MVSGLQELGLGEKEGKIYAAALELGTSSPAQLAERSGVKRPSVYLHLPEMLKKGFMERVRINRKTLYKPKDPAVLEERYKENLVIIENLRNEFRMHQAQIGMPQVSVYEGIENIKPLYTEMGEAHFIRFWSNIGPMRSIFTKEFETLAEDIRRNEINAREIVADTTASRRFMKYIKQITGPTHAVRVSTAEGLDNDNVVTNKALYIFRLHEYNFFAVRIEDATIVSAYRALFDLAWKSAKPL